MSNIQEIARRPEIVATTSIPKTQGVGDVYYQEGWRTRKGSKNTFNPFSVASDSRIDPQPVMREYTEKGLLNRLNGATKAVAQRFPNGIIYAGENGEWGWSGKDIFDIGVLGVRILGDNSPQTSLAYTGSSLIPLSWHNWVHQEPGREYGILIQNLAEKLLGLDPKDIVKDPMGFRSGWRLKEFNRQSIYTHTFRACLSPLVNPDLYDKPPKDLSRAEMINELNTVRKFIEDQQRVPTESVDLSKYVFATGSDNLHKFTGTYGALKTLAKRNILRRIANAHLARRGFNADFQLIAQQVPLGDEAKQPRNAQLIVELAKERAQKALRKTPQALAGIGEQGGIIEIGNGSFFEIHYVYAENQLGLHGGEWTVAFPLPSWFVHQIDTYNTQASHLAMVYGGLGSDPISLFSQGLHYNRSDTINLATMGALLPHAYPELHSPYPFLLNS